MAVIVTKFLLEGQSFERNALLHMDADTKAALAVAVTMSHFPDQEPLVESKLNRRAGVQRLGTVEGESLL